ncbi:hypothetical protein [Teredinibacter haidensis]|uniref:hypothetical protein n=1 Tax=Teredinibacter haidensis TaxID=2731755 RepID=UPI00111533BE|nr:hypothetical protein [Teredinibacter haidensis]
MNKYYSIGILLILVGCSDSKGLNDMSKLEFESTHGWVLVKNGSVSEIQEAILGYDSIAKEQTPKLFSVELHPQENSTTAVLFPDGLPSYDMANITIWLDAPPEQKSVYGARSWLTTPEAKIKYYLKPEVENEWGDTLVGVSEKGIAIRVHAPETGIEKIEKSVVYKSEPKIELNSNPVRFSITLDTDISWANPMFIVNMP